MTEGRYYFFSGFISLLHLRSSTSNGFLPTTLFHLLNVKLPHQSEAGHGEVLPLVGWRAVGAVLLDMHAKEAQVDTIDLFKGKEGFGSIRKGFCHLSTVYKPTRFRSKGKKPHFAQIRIINSNHV